MGESFGFGALSYIEKLKFILCEVKPTISWVKAKRKWNKRKYRSQNAKKGKNQGKRAIKSFQCTFVKDLWKFLIS